MSPRKLTEDDKQEILAQYRNSEATTSTLAKSFEVSSSTISRFLKNKLSTNEYEELIQEKRLARTPRGEKLSEEAQISEPAKKAPKPKSTRKSKQQKLEAEKIDAPELAGTAEPLQDELEQPAKIASTRRRRSSSSASNIAKLPVIEVETEAPEQLSLEPELTSLAPTKLVLDKVRNKSVEETPAKSDRLILKRDRPEPEEEEEEDEMDLLSLREMLGEDLEDIDDDEDEDDDDEDEDDDDEITYPTATTSFSNIQILPLSQASLPRICYIVIDRSAELIVKPLAEFADLGAIPEAEVSQATLPVFDNHRIAKRFSHRRERVIKVPDGRMLQKTSHHLQDKGITRLLVDGQIYSLSQ